MDIQTIQFKQNAMLMESETYEIHTKREDKTHITTIRIFSWRLQRILHMYSIQLQKIAFNVQITRIMSLRFYQH
jgi:hypothetical protein